MTLLRAPRVGGLCRAAGGDSGGSRRELLENAWMMQGVNCSKFLAPPVRAHAPSPQDSATAWAADTKGTGAVSR
jgi:hypothetical protein